MSEWESARDGVEAELGESSGGSCLSKFQRRRGRRRSKDFRASPSEEKTRVWIGVLAVLRLHPLRPPRTTAESDFPET